MEVRETRSKDNRNVFKVFLETFVESEVNIYSIVVTYYLLLSFFPLLIALGNILPYLNLNDQNILPYIEEFLPPDIFNMLKETIANLLNNSSGSLLSISAIGTFWAVSKGINGIQISLNKAYGLKKEKMQFMKRLFSFFMVFLLMITIVLLIVIMGFGQMILEYLLPILGLPNTILSTFQTLKWPLTSSILFVIMLTIYYFVSGAKIHFRTIIPGSIFTTLSWMAVTQFFSLYITYFSKGINSYGIIGSFILFIFWLNVASRLIIIGGVINVTMEKYYYGKIIPRKSHITNYLETQIVKNGESRKSRREDKKKNKR